MHFLKSFFRKLVQPAGFYPIKYYTKYNKMRKSGYLYAV